MPNPPAEPPMRLPARPIRGHKGTFGAVAVVGGCLGPVRMLGAPALAARAAYRAGAGLVRLAMPDGLLSAGMALEPHTVGHALPVDGDGAIEGPDAVAMLDGLCRESSALVLGMGMGVGAGVAAMALRAIQQDLVPAVVDADAINALSALPDLNRECKGRVILTPHPGEFRRLGRALGIQADPTSGESRTAAAESLAQRLGCIVVLKGARSVVTDGQRTWVCRRGHPCLGVAGTGDVLAGLIGGLLAQMEGAGGPADLFLAACIGVEAHAVAGEQWSFEHQASGGLLATELADLLPGALEEYRDAAPADDGAH